MSRVLIVGVGMTGGLCSSLLHRELLNRVRIVMWDKSRGAGEKTATNVCLHPDVLLFLGYLLIMFNIQSIKVVP